MLEYNYPENEEETTLKNELKEARRQLSVFSKFVFNMTNGAASKTNYDLDVYVGFFEDECNKCVEEELAEAHKDTARLDLLLEEIEMGRETIDRSLEDDDE